MSTRQKRVNQKVDDERAQFGQDIRAVMSTPQGRRIISHFIGVDRPSFSNDALVMAFNEGARSTRLGIKNDAKTYASSQYVEMMREQLARIETALVEEQAPREGDEDS